MRKIILLLFVGVGLLGLQNSDAQQPYETVVDGVKVIVHPAGGNNIVEIQTIIKGGVYNYPVDKCGIEELAMVALSECGTLKQDRNEFKNQLDKVSATLFGLSGKDYAVIKMNCVKSDFGVVWPLYVEAITIPKFDPQDFDRIKQEAINNLKSDEGQPDRAIDKLANKIAFAGRDYVKDPDGTVESIEKFTAEETKIYYQSVLTKSRMVMVIVADLDRDVIEKEVHTLLANIKQGVPYELKKTLFRADKNLFLSEQKDLSTNYIEGITSAPAPESSDFNAFNIALRIFSDRHFLEVRTNNALSYSPNVWLNNGTMAVAKFSVLTTQPNKYIEVFNQLVEKTKKDGFTDIEVKNMKTGYLTGFYSRNETNSTLAASLVSSEVLFNNWHRALDLADDVNKLTTKEISDAFRKYIGHIVWVYQGDTQKVNAESYTK